MALPSRFSLLNANLDPFLFASIGKEESGMSLSVASALARLGSDPWIEAERLAGKPNTELSRSFEARCRFQFFFRATPEAIAARRTATATRSATSRLKTLGTMYSELSSFGAMQPAIARAAACFIDSVICRARTSRAPRKIPGNARTLLI